MEIKPGALLCKQRTYFIKVLQMTTQCFLMSIYGPRFLSRLTDVLRLLSFFHLKPEVELGTYCMETRHTAIRHPVSSTPSMVVHVHKHQYPIAGHILPLHTPCNRTMNWEVPGLTLSSATYSLRCVRQATPFRLQPLLPQHMDNTIVGQLTSWVYTYVESFI